MATPRPRIVNFAIWAAWAMAALGAAAILANPWALPVLALPCTLGALGLMRGHAWSGYGLCLWQLAQLGVAGGGSAAGVGLLVGLAGLFFLAGRAAAERMSGRAPVLERWGWVALSAGWLALFAFYQPFQIPTRAMEQTLLIGDQVLVRRAAGDSPRRGDMVVFRNPADRRQTFIKRVVAAPGDRVRIEHKKLFVNGSPAVEPFAVHLTTFEDPYRDNFPREPTVKVFPGAEAMLKDHVVNGEVVVPAGKYFVFGDNRDISLELKPL